MENGLVVFGLGSETKGGPLSWRHMALHGAYSCVKRRRLELMG